jgi:hypothetical protein
MHPTTAAKVSNLLKLYNWARPRSVVVSQRSPKIGTTDALAPLERIGIPLHRTWQRGAVHFQWPRSGATGISTLNLLRAGRILALMNIPEVLADEFEERFNVLATVMEDEHQGYEELIAAYQGRERLLITQWNGILRVESL